MANLDFAGGLASGQSLGKAKAASKSNCSSATVSNGNLILGLSLEAAFQVALRLSDLSDLDCTRAKPGRLANSLVWSPVPEDCDDFLFLSFESSRLQQSHRPWYCYPHSVPVTSSAVIPGQANVSSAATLVPPSPRFPNRCIRERSASRPDLEPKMKGI
jgi:hypothetical protein